MSENGNGKEKTETNIAVSFKTRDKLLKLRKPLSHETYNDTIIRLINFFEENGGKLI